MATLELRDEVDATHADESPSSPASLAAAIKEARDAIERSEELNKRLDPEVGFCGSGPLLSCNSVVVLSLKRVRLTLL